MAGNRNDYFDEDSGEFEERAAEGVKRETGRGFGFTGSPVNESASQMPPRNILETDSAKYTAEYIKEVVKGLYTVDTTAYPEARTEYGDFNDYELNDEPHETPVKSVDVNSRASRYAQTHAKPVALETTRSTRNTDITAEAPNEKRAKERSFEWKSDRQPEWRPEWKSEKPHREQFDRQPEAVPETHSEYRRDRRTEAPEPSHREQSYSFSEDDLPEQDSFQREDFFKSFEDKSRRDFHIQTPRAQRKTFGKSRVDGNTSELENVLTGKPSKKQAGGALAERNTDRTFLRERGEPTVALEQRERTTDGRFREDFLGKPDEEYVYLKAVPEGSASINERIVPPSVNDNTVRPIEQEQEKIPIIINKNIEGRAKKTADDYNRMAGRSGYDRPPLKRMETAEPKSRGVNVFAAVFMVVAIAIIGVLVWKINSMSGEIKSEQSDAEVIARLETQLKSLSQRNSELEYELKQRDEEIEALRAEHRDLTETGNEGSDAEGEQDTNENTPSVNPELVDGYYTVKSGDTLWKISEKFLGNGDQYLKLATANNIDPSKPLNAGLKLKIPTQ